MSHKRYEKENIEMFWYVVLEANKKDKYLELFKENVHAEKTSRFKTILRVEKIVYSIINMQDKNTRININVI